MIFEVLLYLLLSYCIGSCLEWFAHNFIMHNKIKGLEQIYKDHAVHHGFYRNGEFANDGLSSKRYLNLVVCLEHNIVLASPFILILLFVKPLFAFTLLLVSLGHLVLFNKVHAGIHLRHDFKYFPKWYIKFCKYNHFLHHQHPGKHFSVVFPGADYLLGTFSKPTNKDLKDWEKVLQEDISLNDDKDGLKQANNCKIPAFFKKLEFNNTDGNIPETPSPQKYKIGKAISEFIVKWQVKSLNISGTLPDNNIILACNHTSWMDAFVIIAAFNRPFRVMMAEAVGRNNILFSWFFPEYLGMYPASSKKAVDASIEILKSGQSIAICPSGLVESTGQALPFKTGTVRIAARSNTPIVPVYIKYENYPGKWILKFPLPIQFIITGLLQLNRGQCRIVIGLPISSLPEDVKDATKVLEQEVKSLGMKVND